jgi:hypothetical protein
MAALRDFEIIHDPKAAAILEGLRLDPARHEVLAEGEWLKAAKRATGRSTLLIYRHRETGQFVLADKIYEPDVVMELEAWPAPPEWLGVHMEWIKLRCVPQEEMAKRCMDKMRECSYRRRQKTAANEEELRDTQRWLRREGMEHTAAMIGTQPYTGKEEGGEQYERTREELNRMAKVAS